MASACCTHRERERERERKGEEGRRKEQARGQGEKKAGRQGSPLPQQLVDEVAQSVVVVVPAVVLVVGGGVAVAVRCSCADRVGV